MEELTQVKNYSEERRVDGRRLARKLVAGDKIYSLASGAVTQSSIANGAVGAAQLKYEAVTVTISAGTASGTATVVSGDVVIGFRPIAVDQVIKTISVSGTTLTVTLNANATGQNQIEVILIKT